MAKYDFRILLESVQGVKTSYMSSSFVDTGVDLVLSASQVYNRITGSVSCSYQNSRIFTGTFGSSSFVDNNILSASLTGSLSEGAIIFNSTNTEYDRLKRYKFFGEKVCGTLGLPENQWIFVDQFRLAADDEDNFFEGNVNARNLYVSEDLSFANNSTINSDVPIFIDTGSDRHIKFIDERTTGDVPLFIGYDKDLDFYEIGGSTTKTLIISDVNRLQANEISHSAHVHASPVGVDLCHELRIGGSLPALKMIEFDETDDGGVNPDTSFFLNNHKLTISNGTNSDDGDIEIRTQGFNDAIYIKNSADSVGIGENNPQSTLDIDGDLRVQSHITCSGNIKLDGTIFANEYHTTFTSASIIFASGSTIFGDTVDDIHNFTGSVHISGGITSSTDIYLDNFADTAIRFIDGTGGGTNNFLKYNEWRQAASAGTTINNTAGTINFDSKGNADVMVISGSNVGIGTTSPTKTLQVEGDISASGDLFLNEGGGVVFSETDNTFISMSGNDLFVVSDDDMIFRTDDDFIFRGGSSKNISLFIDGDNQRVGIGGVSSPTRTLDVHGSMLITGSSDQNLLIENKSNDEKLILQGQTGFGAKMKYERNGGSYSFFTGMLTNSSQFSIADNSNNELISVFYDGQVGIGESSLSTSSPKLTVGGNMKVNSHITASGNISASGKLYGTDVYLGDDAEFRTTAGHLTIRPEEDLRLGTVSTDNILIGRLDTGVTTIQSKKGLLVSGSGHITASGNISGSATSTGSFGMGFFEGRVGIGDTPIDAPLEVHLGDTSQIISDRAGNGSNIVLKRSGTTKGTLSTNNTSGKEFEIFSSGDLIFNESNGDNVGIGITSPGEKLTVEGNISASAAISASIVQAKTFKSEKIFSFFNPASDGTKYYFPIGAHYIQSTVGPAIVNPSNAFSMTAMCDLSIKRIKIQFAFGVLTVGTSFKMYCRKWNGSGAVDSDSQFVDVGTAWTVTTSNIADNDRFFHAPSDWNISAGDIWGIQYQLNGNDGLVWFSGGLVIEEDWNTLISS